jgi:hypothetical protein
MSEDAKRAALLREDDALDALFAAAVNAAMKTFMHQGLIRETGELREGRIVWELTEFGKRMLLEAPTATQQ